MKKVGLAITTALVLATTVPAVAQRYDGGRGWWGGERHYGDSYRPYRYSYRTYRRDCHRDWRGGPCVRGYGYRSWWGGRY